MEIRIGVIGMNVEEYMGLHHLTDGKPNTLADV